MRRCIAKIVLATVFGVAVCAPGIPDALPAFAERHDPTECGCCGQDRSGPQTRVHSGFGTDSPLEAKQPSPKQGAWSKEAKAALAQLKEGNERFAGGKPKYKHTSLEWRTEIAKKQKPFATILGCSDSRVAPELVFDQGLGSLFVVRVAGNIVNMDIDGSLQYAGRHLGTRLFMVLGHENCGAVSAALAAQGKEKEPPGLHQLIENLRPVFKNIDAKLPQEKRLAVAVEANVRWSMKQLTDVPEHKKALDDGKVTLVGAVYDLETGKVRVLD